MLAPDSFPTASDVERFGNLLLQAWAPPGHECLANAWIESAIGAFLGGPNEIFLLGHRPGLLQNLPSEALSVEASRLLSAVTKELQLGPLHRISHEDAIASAALLRSGDLHVRERRLDDSTGMMCVTSKHLGRVLVRSSAAEVLRVIQGGASRPPLQLHLSCLTNPHAGLRQPDAKWLRSIRSWTGAGLAVTWKGDSLHLFGGRATLLDVRVRLLEWLPAPASEA